jgi:CRP-like cAMP-binding protein
VSFFEDGRRQVGAFYLPGEFFGFNVSAGSFSAEAVVDTELTFVRRAHVMELARAYPVLADELLVRTTEALHRACEHMLLLGRQTAEERLENFLIDMADRIGNGNSVELPMDRRDIADYLALAIETVSRTFAELERKRRIETPSSRRIHLTGSLGEWASTRTYAHVDPSTPTGTRAFLLDATG